MIRLPAVVAGGGEPGARIEPEPDEAVRAAILRALGEPEAPPLGGWAAAALREAVAPADAGPVSGERLASFEHHDVCSLW